MDIRGIFRQDVGPDTLFDIQRPKRSKIDIVAASERLLISKAEPIVRICTALAVVEGLATTAVTLGVRDTPLSMHWLMVKVPVRALLVVDSPAGAT